MRSGVLVQNKQSFKVKGVEFEPPKDITVIQEVRDATQGGGEWGSLDPPPPRSGVC